APLEMGTSGAPSPGNRIQHGGPVRCNASYRSGSIYSGPWIQWALGMHCRRAQDQRESRNNQGTRQVVRRAGCTSCTRLAAKFQRLQVILHPNIFGQKVIATTGWLLNSVPATNGIPQDLSRCELVEYFAVQFNSKFPG